MLDRLRWEEHQGKRVLVLDFSRAKVSESLALISRFAEAVDKEPDHSVRMLSDVSDAEYDPAVANQWKAIRLARNHKMSRSAIYGLHGLVEVAVRAFHQALSIFGRKAATLKIFHTREEAIKWLLEG
jgi:hypothetical protein